MRNDSLLQEPPEESTIFDYLERNRLHLGMSLNARDKVDELIKERNDIIFRYCTDPDKDFNAKIEMYINAMKKNNRELKAMLHIK